MVELEDVLKLAVEQQASDVFIMAGLPLSYKLKGKIVHFDDKKISPEISEQYIRKVYTLGGRDPIRLIEHGDDDFSFSLANISRFRVSSYKQRGSLAAVIRLIPFGIPDYQALNIPEEVMKVGEKGKGMVLVTGPAGGGKSTTLACIIDRINHTRSGHIITLEEPIEYLHRNDQCAISQREIELDTENMLTALRACLRQAPDVILVGEMRDFETIRTAMTAAETGHLVISTLHTVGAANTIDRIIDVFPPNQQQQIRVQLSMLLQSVISQQLIPTLDGGQIPVFEIMHLNNAIRNMIRESKIHQLDALISSSGTEGMVSMDSSLMSLVKAGKITKATAVKYATNPDIMEKRMNLL